MHTDDKPITLLEKHQYVLRIRRQALLDAREYGHNQDYAQWRLLQRMKTVLEEHKAQQETT